MGREPVDTDEDALFAALYPGLRRWAAVTGPAEVDPDDLVQEAVARTLRTHALSDLDDAGAYLRRAIVNLSANHRRGLARLRGAVTRLSRSSDDESRPPEYASDLADLMQVAPEARAVLWLVEVEDNTYAAAAAVLGITEEAARTRAARARRQLRLHIEQDEKEQ